MGAAWIRVPAQIYDAVQTAYGFLVHYGKMKPIYSHVVHVHLDNSILDS